MNSIGWPLNPGFLGLVYYKAVCRTAQAIPGLSTIIVSIYYGQLRDVARLKSLQNLGAFLCTLRKTETFCTILKIFGSFWGVFLFDKYVEILCYFRELFQCFGNIWKLFGVFLTNFENAQKFFAIFCVIF